jgi:hypothetical protein
MNPEKDGLWLDRWLIDANLPSGYNGLSFIPASQLH